MRSVSRHRAGCNVPDSTAVRMVSGNEHGCSHFLTERFAACPFGGMTPEQCLTELNVVLPPAPKPVAVYKPLVIVDRMAYVSGHGPLNPDKSLILGVVGRDLSMDEGKAAARQVGLAILATLRDQLGSLDRVKRIVKVLGMVNTAPDFYDHPKVINGCSELFAEIWGPENGVGARSAVGMGPLPGNIAVEIEAIFELHA